MPRRVLISNIQLQETFDRYEATFDEKKIEVDRPQIMQQLTERELLEIIGQYDGIIAGDDFITRKVLEAGKKLKIVAKWGVGVDNIDQAAAADLGIEVLNTPNMFADEVGDVAMGYIILLARGLHKIDAAVRRGEWLKIRGTTLRGKTAGVIGLGSVGRAVVQRVVAHGMDPIGHDIVRPAEQFVEDIGLELAELDQLLTDSDFVILCCNLTEANRHMLDECAFGLMKRGVRIVNVARGPLIDEEALHDALMKEHVAGAALDVFESEPISGDHPLTSHDNVIFGAHNSSNTIEGVLRTNEKAISNLFSVLR